MSFDEPLEEAEVDETEDPLLPLSFAIAAVFRGVEVSFSMRAKTICYSLSLFVIDLLTLYIYICSYCLLSYLHYCISRKELFYPMSSEKHLSD